MGCQVNKSLAPVEIKNEWSYTSTPQFAFMAYTVSSYLERHCTGRQSGTRWWRVVTFTHLQRAHRRSGRFGEDTSLFSCWQSNPETAV